MKVETDFLEWKLDQQAQRKTSTNNNRRMRLVNTAVTVDAGHSELRQITADSVDDYNHLNHLAFQINIDNENLGTWGRILTLPSIMYEV